MIRFTLLSLFVVLTLLSPLDQTTGAEESVYPPTEGAMQGFVLLKERRAAPDVPFVNEAGQEISLADFQGRVVLVNFWATWCAPCVEELPGLDRLQTQMGGSDFQVVAVNEDAGPQQKAESFLRDRLNLSALALYQDRRMQLAQAFRVRAFPTTLLLDRQGRLVGHYTGPTVWDSDDAVRLIQAVMDE